jgi:PAS domain S-box-containing protein
MKLCICRIGDWKPLKYYAGPVVLFFVILVIITWYFLSQGITTVFPHLYYLFIIPVVYLFQLRGVVLTGLLAAVYLALCAGFSMLIEIQILDCIIRSAVFIGIALVVSYLSKHCEEGELFRTYFAATGTGRAIVNQDGTIADINDKIESMTGYTREEIVGHAVSEFIAPEDRDRLQVYQHQRLNDPESHPPDNYECTLQRKDGEPVYCCCTSAVIPDTTRVITSIQDVSKLKKIQKELEASELKFREIFNNANDAIFLHALDSGGIPGEILEVNRQGCRMLQYTRDDLKKPGFQSIDTRRQWDKNAELKAELNRTGRVQFEGEMMRKDGSYLPVEVNAHQFMLSEIPVVLSIVKDITAKKKTGEQMKLAISQINDNLIQLSTLNDSIRNPLAIMMGMMNDICGETERETIIDQINEIDGIINRLDQGWLVSLKVRDILKKHYDIAE